MFLHSSTEAMYNSSSIIQHHGVMRACHQDWRRIPCQSYATSHRDQLRFFPRKITKKRKRPKRGIDAGAMQLRDDEAKCQLR